MNKAQRVAVCIVTYNSATDLETCLTALAATSYQPLELVVVDCGSADDSLRQAEALCAGMPFPSQILPLGENRGFAGGMNAAFAATDAPLLLCLNADACVEPDFVRRLVAGLEQQPRAGAVTGRLVRPPTAEGRFLDACGMVLTRSWRHLDRGSGERDSGQYSEPQWVFGGTGAALLLRRAALDDVRLENGDVLDTLFHSYREDAELAFRLQARGWGCLYQPDAVAEHRRHVVPGNRRQVAAEINYHSLKNRYLLRLYHQSAANALRTLLPTLWRDLQAFGYVLLRERSSLPAYAWLWRHHRQLLARRAYLAARRTAPAEATERFFKIPAFPI
jgi:GT2 family glycosyltransferase